jgi:hypothetical protein
MSNIISHRQQPNKAPALSQTRGSEKSSSTQDAKGSELRQSQSMSRKSEAEYQEATGREHSELFKATEERQKQNHQSRAQLRDAKRPLLNSSEIKDKAQQLWGDKGQDKLQQLADRALHTLKEGGASALRALRSGLPPLEQFLLLSKMGERLGEGDSAAHKDIEEASLQLQLQHGPEIKRLLAAGTPMANLGEEAPPPPNEAMKSLRSDAARSTGDAVLSAAKLIPLLVEKFGAKDFEASLERMSKSGVLDALKKSHPTREVNRVRIAMTNGAALNTVRKAFNWASKRMRPRLAAGGMRLNPDDDAKVAGTLLEQCAMGVNNPGQLAGSLFGSDNGQRIMDSPDLLDALRHGVKSTPENWWPQDKKGKAPERLQVLEMIDKRISGLQDSGIRPETVRREKQLRSTTSGVVARAKGAPVRRTTAAT